MLDHWKYWYNIKTKHLKDNIYKILQCNTMRSLSYFLIISFWLKNIFVVLAYFETNPQICQYTRNGLSSHFSIPCSTKLWLKKKAKIKIFKLLDFSLDVENNSILTYCLRDWDTNDNQKQASNTMKNYQLLPHLLTELRYTVYIIQWYFSGLLIRSSRMFQPGVNI